MGNGKMADVMAAYKTAFGAFKCKPLTWKPFGLNGSYKFVGIAWLGVFFVQLALVFFGIPPGLGIALGILLGTASLNLCVRHLRGEEAKVADLFAFFGSWADAKRVLGGTCWVGLWLFVWGIIPIVGPILATIKFYEYCLVPFILANEPDVKPTDAVQVSKQRMDGWKIKLFLADLLVLVALFVVMGILLGIIVAGDGNFISLLFILILGILYLVVCALGPAFYGLVHAWFYERIGTVSTAVESAPEAK